MLKAQTSQLSITMFQNMSEAYQLPEFLEFVFLLTAFFACKFAKSHHASFTLYFCPILSRYITVFLCISMQVLLYLLCCDTSLSPSGFRYTSLRFFRDMLSTISST